MSKVYILRKGDLVVGVYDDLKLLSSNLSSTEGYEQISNLTKGDKILEYGKYNVELFILNENNIRPNQIIYKSKEFNLNNLENPLPLVDVSDPSYL